MIDRGWLAALSLDERLLELDRTEKRLIALVVDVVLCLLTVVIAFYLRYGQWIYPRGTTWLAFAAAVGIAIPLFVRFGLYRAIFRYGGARAMHAIVRACALYGMLYAAVFTVIGIFGVPRTVGLIQPLLLLLAIGGSRWFAHYWLGGGYRRLLNLGKRRRVLIYGAGSAGRQLTAALAASHDLEVVGFADDDSRLHGRQLDGYQIFPTENLPDLVEHLKVSDLLLAMPSASRKRREEIFEHLKGVSAAVRTLPGMSDLVDGKVTLSDLRELQIEDLLSREQVLPDRRLLASRIKGKRVLITGAGGSIGSELTRQIFDLEPELLLLVDSSEYNLYVIQQAIEALGAAAHRRPVSLLASVTDERRMRAIFEAWQPETIFHAAAYKHVPLVEHNVIEGTHNNAFGTLVVAREAIRSKAKDMVLISTDKAVRPTNVMGASKRLAEMILQALAATQQETCFTMVRFGNVLNSSGSVVPLFREQIRKGGPVTITDEHITRYFMTIPEAAQLVIQSASMGSGGEVFVLDMGEPVRIVDLARRMIELSGFTIRDQNNPDGDIEIKTIGLRPGEKLYEELLIGDNPVPTPHPRIMKANERFLPWGELAVTLNALAREISSQDAARVFARLAQLVPEFTPAKAVVDWTHAVPESSERRATLLN